MISNDSIAGVVIGALIFFMILLVVMVFIWFKYFLVITIDTETNEIGVHGRNLSHRSFLERKCSQSKKDPNKIDLEKAIPELQNETLDQPPSIDEGTVNFNRLVESFNTSTFGIFETKKSGSSKNNTSSSKYLADQYDIFSNTLMLQNLIKGSINANSSDITELKDNYSNKKVQIGGIVVVIKPYVGKNENEFNLQPGDLLRLLKFFDQDDEVYCTGIMLNTFLEYNSLIRNFNLKLKSESAEFELIKNFPFKVVSLETTLLNLNNEYLNNNEFNINDINDIYEFNDNNTITASPQKKDDSSRFGEANPVHFNFT